MILVASVSVASESYEELKASCSEGAVRRAQEWEFAPQQFDLQVTKDGSAATEGFVTRLREPSEDCLVTR